MTERDNTNRGAAWKNDKEGGNPNWPDYRGNVNVEGKEFWFDCWIKTIQQGEKKGQKFLSFAVKPKMAREHKGAAENPPAQKAAAQPHSDFDDSIPFAFAYLIPLGGLVAYAVSAMQTVFQV